MNSNEQYSINRFELSRLARVRGGFADGPHAIPTRTFSRDQVISAGCIGGTPYVEIGFDVVVTDPDWYPETFEEFEEFGKPGKPDLPYKVYRSRAIDLDCDEMRQLESLGLDGVVPCTGCRSRKLPQALRSSRG